MHNVYLKKRHRGHPWIFSNEIRREEEIHPGEIVKIYQGRTFLGRGFYNPHSLIAIRRFSITDQEFDQQFLDGRIDKALAYRRTWSKENSFRLVHSESDGLPGLIIDKYEDNFVVQINCYGMDQKRDMIIRSLARMDPGFIYEKNDTQLRKLEGLEPRQGLLYGELSNPVLIKQDDIPFFVDVEKGQKTGFFFDLADIRKYVKGISEGRKAIDLFCYSGSFTLYAARGGARSVTGVDSSQSAIAQAIKNCANAGITGMKFVCADAFNFLSHDDNFYDLIIVDPPSFTKSRKSIKMALRGYQKINLQAMNHLENGGFLVTTTCSYHITDNDFQELLRKAALEAGIKLNLRSRATQSLDHPILLNMPESHYLKCFVLQRTD